jgi:integrating conjugative element protein (TIGR03759 family)
MQSQRVESFMKIRVSRLCIAVATMVFSTGALSALNPVTTGIATTALQSSQTNQTPLSATEKVRAYTWGLSETDWRRYRDLMQGIRGSISPSTISPVEVLGIHARDPGERNRFADQWARAMREDVERILAFQYAYDAAAKRLYAGQDLIDTSRLPVRTDTGEALKQGDRVLFFTRPDCPACDRVWERVRRQIGQVAGVDIYLAGISPGDDQAVREWAARHSVDPDWVHRRLVTLNHQGDVLERLSDGRVEPPFLMRYREGEATILPSSSLK